MPRTSSYNSSDTVLLWYRTTIDTYSWCIPCYPVGAALSPCGSYPMRLAPAYSYIYCSCPMRRVRPCTHTAGGHTLASKSAGCVRTHFSSKAYFNKVRRVTKRGSSRVHSSSRDVDDTTPRAVGDNSESVVLLRLQTRRAVGKTVTTSHACLLPFVVVITTRPLRPRPLVEVSQWALPPQRPCVNRTSSRIGNEKSASVSSSSSFCPSSSSSSPPSMKRYG